MSQSFDGKGSGAGQLRGGYFASRVVACRSGGAAFVAVLVLAAVLVALVAVPASGQNSPITLNVKDYSTVHVTVGQTFTITVTESGAEPTFEWGVTDGVGLGSGKFGVGTVFNKTNAS